MNIPFDELWEPEAASEYLCGNDSLEQKVWAAVLANRLAAEKREFIHTPRELSPFELASYARAGLGIPAREEPRTVYRYFIRPIDAVGWAIAEGIEVLPECREWYAHITGSRRPVRIDSATHEELLSAIAAFPDEYPEFQLRKPKLNADIRPWLKAKHAMSDSKAHVFGTIIAEHFKL